MKTNYIISLAIVISPQDRLIYGPGIKEALTGSN